ncbi:MAG: flagellar hook assembly protein FlgD [Nitrospirae bacterium]|nr:flagellar hook assembly protein FlgD [Nitrospirota bacterium]MBI3594019.1 flagellar hook assembly protein FlgD [Nitrospirota bacterium]
MSTVPVTATTPNPIGTPPVGINTLGQNAFLKLLTTQLRYQDPLKPMDNTQFVSQLSQFSQLEQLTNLNQTMTTMGSNFSTMNNNQVVNLLGKNVIAQGGTVSLNGGTAPSLFYTLNGNASAVTLSITDSTGNLVRTIDMGPQASGRQSASWDGLNNAGTALPQGDYQYSVSAKDTTGNAVSNTTYTQGLVSGITYNNGAAYLIVNGTMIPASGLLQIN